MSRDTAIGKLMCLRTLIRAARTGTDAQVVWVACDRNNVEAIEEGIAALEKLKAEGQ